jgi:hypothetical protein
MELVDDIELIEMSDSGWAGIWRRAGLHDPCMWIRRRQMFFETLTVLELVPLAPWGIRHWGRYIAYLYVELGCLRGVEDTVGERREPRVMLARVCDHEIFTIGVPAGERGGWEGHGKQQRNQSGSNQVRIRFEEPKVAGVVE